MADSSCQAVVNSEWNAMAGEWDDLALSYAKDIFKSYLKEDHLKAEEGLLIVDFGCGTGLLLGMMRHHASRMIGVDASSKMIEVLEDKIRSHGWDNVQAICTTIALETNPILASLFGKVDLLVSTSVLNFVPQPDLPPTMKALGRLLRPGGSFFHSDWAAGDNQDEGMSPSKAKRLYEMAGLQAERFTTYHSTHGQIFIGVAKKPWLHVD